SKRKPTATVARFSGRKPPKVVTTRGTNRVATASPIATPSQPRARAMKPSRHPPIAAPKASTTTTKSSAFTSRSARSRLPRQEAEHDPIEVVLAEPFVRGAHFAGQWHVAAEEAVHVPYRALREVVADLVARHPSGWSDGAQQRGRQSARSDTGLEHTRAGEDV